MAPISSAWSFDPSAFRLSSAAQRACDLILEVDDDQRGEAINFGTWWVVPIGRTLSDRIIGIRIVPGLPLSESPVVRLAEHEVETFASKPASLVPRALFPGSVLKPEYWDSRRDLPDGTWRELEALHAALGGADQLSGIKSALHDASLREVCVNAFSDAARFASSAFDIFQRIDSAPETQRYCEYARKAVGDFDAPLPIPDVGAWRAATTSLAFICNQGEDESGQPNPRELQAAWEVARQPPALDSFQAFRPAFNPKPIGKSQQRLLLDASKVLAKRADEAPPEWKSDPWWDATIALTKGENGGTPHMDAAGILKKAGRREEAFTALTAAAFWFYVHIKRPFPQLLNAAFLLARESNWGEAAELLEAISAKIPE